MKAKSEARSIMQNFLAFAFTQFGATVKCIRTDNGQEFNDPYFLYLSQKESFIRCPVFKHLNRTV